MRNEPLEVLVEELVQLAEGVSKGLLSIVIPPARAEKIKWCRCKSCGAWHSQSS